MGMSRLAAKRRTRKRALIHQAMIFRKSRHREGTQWIENFSLVETAPARFYTITRGESATANVASDKEVFTPPSKVLIGDGIVKPDDRLIPIINGITLDILYEVDNHEINPSFLSVLIEVPISLLPETFSIDDGRLVMEGERNV